MTITAKIIADSISPAEIRLTTFQLKYPRFLHSELMTHRVFSRNASSSRAIPVQRIIKAIQEEPAMPIYWGLNQKGMQAREEAAPDVIPAIETDWLQARDLMIEVAQTLLTKYNLHKQLVNRILEPWSHIYVVVTATEWDNFFNLRRHPDAMPEIRALADRMWEGLEAATPQRVIYDDWHLPYILQEDWEKWRSRDGNSLELVQVSTARCARVSYRTHDGLVPKFEEDLGLHEGLVSSGHLSPLEHPATPNENNPEGFCGNFRGWLQYRKTVIGEDVFQLVNV